MITKWWIFIINFPTMFEWGKNDDVFLKKLGERISTLRKQKGMPQVELASYLGIEKSNMSRLEAGKTNPSILILKKICESLNIRIEDFLKDIDNETL